MSRVATTRDAPARQRCRGAPLTLRTAVEYRFDHGTKVTPVAREALPAIAEPVQLGERLACSNEANERLTKLYSRCIGRRTAAAEATA